MVIRTNPGVSLGVMKLITANKWIRLQWFSCQDAYQVRHCHLQPYHLLHKMEEDQTNAKVSNINTV